MNKSTKKNVECNGRPCRLQNTLNAVDIFPQRIPGFNIHGKTTTPTITGGIFSFCIFTLMMVYSLPKLVHVL